MPKAVCPEGYGEANSPATLARKLAASALGHRCPRADDFKIDAAALAKLEGVYRTDTQTARVLRLVNGKLTVQRIGSDRFSLSAIGPDDFLYPDGLNRVRIDRDSAGIVSSLRFLAEGEAPGLLMPRMRESLPTAREEVPLRQSELDSLLGTYAAAEKRLKIAFEGRHLMAQIGRERPVEIFAQSNHAFFMTTFDDMLDFQPGAGNASEVTLHHNGDAIAFQRR